MSFTLPPLSDEQSAALEAILNWLKRHHDAGGFDPAAPRLTLGGYAGTGKTTLIAHLKKALGNDRPLAFISLTGKAVAQMENKLRGSNIASWSDNISTIHSFCYIPVINEATGEIEDWRKRPMLPEDGRVELKPGQRPDDFTPWAYLIINDEASMTSPDLQADLETYHRPVLYVGDHGQLPPVKGQSSLMLRPDLRLETPHRAALENPITLLATEVRQGKNVLQYGTSTTDEGLVEIMPTRAFSDSEAEALLASGSRDVLCITATHKKRVGINRDVLRAKRMNLYQPDKDTRILCIRNDRRAGIYNGMFGTVEKVLDPISRDNHHLMIRTDDFDRLLRLEVAKYPFGQEYAKKPEDLPFYRVKTLWDFGYCLTCHKAQGSEADNVIVIGRGFGDSEMRRRWMYTAVTRAKKRLSIVL